ncbi:MAG: hypothetical protein L3J44_01355 [Campylobacteraceae bacterium]|nr:hypothetical protein [Campylobacteraceae bacterium]
MRLLIKFLMISVFAICLQAKSYIYIEGGIKLPLKNQGVVVYNGVPVDVVSKGKKSVKIKMSGYVKTKSAKALYATKNLKLLFATVKDPKTLKISGNKGTLEVSLPKKNITDDMDEAWETNSDLFYNKCTKCHHAKIVEAHSMQTWDVLFSSMQPKARTTKKQGAMILRFLRAFAKDGILRESD